MKRSFLTFIALMLMGGSALAGQIYNPGAGTAGTVAAANGGTGATSLGTMFTNTGSVFNTTQLLDVEIGTTYAIPSADAAKIVTSSNAAAQAYSLPQATTAGYTAGYSYGIQNLSTADAGVLTITPTTSTINGNATLVLPPNGGGCSSIVSDGTNYQISGCLWAIEQGFTSAAVNFLKVTPSATGSAIAVSTVGTDTNIGLTILSKGTSTAAFGVASTGSVGLQLNGSNRLLMTTSTSTFTPPIIGAGTKFTLSSCSASALTGGSFIGKFTCGVSSSCTQVVTLNGASGSTAPSGWTCFANDETTPANKFQTTASSTTTATILGTCVTNDIISFACFGY